jgi:hypothetical protein
MDAKFINIVIPAKAGIQIRIHAFQKLTYNNKNPQVQSFPRSARSEAKRRSAKRGGKRESKPRLTTFKSAIRL